MQFTKTVKRRATQRDACPRRIILDIIDQFWKFLVIVGVLAPALYHPPICH